MNQILKSLETITTGFSVFEKDQVLTHDQLNSVAAYGDDQSRLTRTKLLGVGIACGLRLISQNGSLTVTKGVGITTDGDLLYLAGDTVFDKFKLYDDSNPKYDLFFSGDTMNTIYQALVEGTAETDTEAKALSDFNSETGAALDNMVALLFMEGYIKDQDVCSGTDCDNLGQDFVSTVRLLLIDKGLVGPLQKSLPTPAQAGGALSEIVADRALLAANITTTGQLTAVYRTAASSVQTKLLAELPKLYPNCSTFLGDAFAADPTDGWIAKLNSLNTAFSRSDSGIQYYYDFLKDVVETWNDLRILLLTSTASWCCPEIDGFAKHLLLGNTGSDSDPAENRTGFYPSPIVARSLEELDHAQFLARKLDTLIQTFQVPAAVSGVGITPSTGEETSLEERAIPYYYEINTTNPVQEAWNYRLHKEGMDAANYSYNAAAYRGQGAAANPLAAPLGRFGFLRIEGHLGQDVTAARAAIEAKIKASNLPFTIQTVFLGADKTKVIKRPGILFSDLHRLHQVLRTDLSDQLENAKTFSSYYVQQVNTLTSNDVDDVEQTKTVATQKSSALTAAATDAQTALKQNYVAYKASTTWTPAVSTATTSAAEFKQNLNTVTSTSFNTPFDSLVSSSHANWLNWLDVHIQDKADKEDEKLLFSNFQASHPGLEHFGGVVRGGTFVLAYDENNKVIADFMLPYYWPEPAREEDPAEPTLSVPPVKSNTVLTNGIKLGTTLDKFVATRLSTFKTDVVDSQINVQTGLIDKTFSLFGNLAGGSAIKSSGITTGIDVANPYLSAQLTELNAQKEQIDILNKQIASPDTSDSDRATAQTEVQAKEQDFAKKTSDVANLLVTAKEGEISSADQEVALSALAVGSSQLTNTEARTTAKTAITGATAKTTNVGLQNRLSQIGATFG